MIRLVLAFLWLAAQPALAVTLSLPLGAVITEEATSPDAAYLATGPAQDGAVPFAQFHGHVLRQAWRVPGSQTTYQLIQPLTEQLEKAGFSQLTRCATQVCGGFDFRVKLPVMAEPGMHVDLGDFRYLLASKPGPDGPVAVSLLVSRSSTDGFIQIITVDPAAAPPRVAAKVAAPGAATGAATGSSSAAPASDRPKTPPTELASTTGTLIERLERNGHAILEHLKFDSGSSSLDPGRYPALAVLAGYLKADPARKVAIVGHTDAVGKLAANIALSRKRAASVVDRLQNSYGVAAGQMVAEGVGFLAPRATNLTPEGRDLNRRVEVVLLPD